MCAMGGRDKVLLYGDRKPFSAALQSCIMSYLFLCHHGALLSFNSYKSFLFFRSAKCDMLSNFLKTCKWEGRIYVS